MKTLLFLVVLLLFFILSGCDNDSSTPEPSFENLEEEVSSLVDPSVRVGMIVGIIDKDHQQHILTFGSKSRFSEEPLDENTVFDIGSLTKTFTATLLAQKYLNEDLTEDAVPYYLPDGKVTLPTWNGVEITIMQVATHTSGMPRTPHEEGSAFPKPSGFDPLNPYAAYTTEDIYNYLSNYCKLSFEPGTRWQYSNTGYGLLGHIIGLYDSSTYENVLNREIFLELEMTNSSLFLTENQQKNIALGYSIFLQEVPFYIANDIFQGAGFIKSTLADLFKYLEANAGLKNTTLKDAMDLTHLPQVHQISLGDQGIAWFILELDDGQKVIYSGGNTQGHSCYLGFNKNQRTGAIILSNFDMDGDQLELGAKIMKVIQKY